MGGMLRSLLMKDTKTSILYINVKSTINSWIHSTIAKNAASLYILQFAGYILPLITVPYLVRVLHPTGFGIVAFGQGLMAYFSLLTDYGFAYSATRKISVQRDDIMAVSTTASNVWAAKIILLLAGFIILLLAVTSIPILHESGMLLIILYGTVIGNVLFPTWLFQGMEKMVAISIINLITQFVVTIGVFIVIRKPDDYLIYAGLLSLASIISGIIGIVSSFYMFDISLTIPSKKSIVETFREGWVLFLSMLSVSLYTTGNTFILGLLTNNAVVGYYSAASKIVNAVLGLINPITQAVYPRFSKLASESKALALQWSRKILGTLGGLGMILSLILIIGAPIIVNIILGSEYEPSIRVIQILAALPLLVAISNVLGIQIMVPFGKDKAFTSILFGAGIINILLAIILTPIWKESGMAISVILSETIVTTVMFIYLWVKKINPFHYDIKEEVSI